MILSSFLVFLPHYINHKKKFPLKNAMSKDIFKLLFNQHRTFLLIFSFLFIGNISLSNIKKYRNELSSIKQLTSILAKTCPNIRWLFLGL